MGKDLEISGRQAGDIFILYLAGDLTATAGEQVEEAYRRQSEAGAAKILFHIDRGSYINSGGIAALIGIVAAARQKQQIVRFSGLSDHFQKIFRMVGLTKYAEIFPDEQAALAGF